MVDPRPSMKEVEEHLREHIPFRSWCHHCVAGIGVSDRHTRESEIGEIPVSGMDYFLFTRELRRKKRKEEESNGVERRIEGMPVLIMVDRTTNMRMTEVMPRKETYELCN